MSNIKLIIANITIPITLIVMLSYHQIFMICTYIMVLTITSCTGTNWGSFDRRFQLTENEMQHETAKSDKAQVSNNR